MKKMGQLCAYLTKNADDFNYHSQKGKSLKDSYFQVNLNDSVLMIGEKKFLKIAEKLNKPDRPVGYMEDKGVKIVQCFQGIVQGEKTGVVYDSEDARKIASVDSEASLTWHAPPKAGSKEGQSYRIWVQGILSNKDAPTQQPLPRLVDPDAHNDNTKTTGFGHRIHATNRKLCAGRQGPSMLFFGNPSASHVNACADNGACKPICNIDGTARGQYGFRF
jgi:hypothetical protein